MSGIELRVAVEPIGAAAVENLLAQPNQRNEGAEGTGYNEETLHGKKANVFIIVVVMLQHLLLLLLLFLLLLELLLSIV